MKYLYISDVMHPIKTLPGCVRIARFAQLGDNTYEIVAEKVVHITKVKDYNIAFDFADKDKYKITNVGLSVKEER